MLLSVESGCQIDLKQSMLGYEHHSPSQNSATRSSISWSLHVTFEYKFCCLMTTLQIGMQKREQDSNLIKSLFAFLTKKVLSLLL